jgi:Tripartite tricarboxylate transporter TctB family
MMRTLGRVVLMLLALLCLGLLVATPELIKPFPQAVPWFESPAMFPRVALILALVGATVEWLLRKKNLKLGDSDELDSSEANVPVALMVIGAFIGYCLLMPLLGYMSSTLLFLLISGKLAGLPWKTAAVLGVSLSIAMWAVFQIGLKVAFGHGWLI